MSSPENRRWKNRLRGRRVVKRPRSRNERLWIGHDRYLALWHAFNYGTRYRHSRFMNGSRFLQRGSEIMMRTFKALHQPDPREYYQSPWVWRDPSDR